MRYRRRFDILADIVSVAGQGTRKTKIMYFANLSYLLLTKYLEDGLRVGFLRSAGEEFSVTRKGEEFLQRYRQFSSRYARVEQNVKALQSEAEELEKMCQPRKANGRNFRRRSKLAMLG